MKYVFAHDATMVLASWLQWQLLQLKDRRWS